MAGAGSIALAGCGSSHDVTLDTRYNATGFGPQSCSSTSFIALSTSFSALRGAANGSSPSGGFGSIDRRLQITSISRLLRARRWVAACRVCLRR